MDLSQLGDSSAESEQARASRVAANNEASRRYKARKRAQREADCLAAGIPFRTHKWRKRLPGETDGEFRKRWWREFHARNKESRNAAKKRSRAKNPEKYKAASKAWREANPEKAKAIVDRWHSDPKNKASRKIKDSIYAKNNRAKLTAQQCIYISERRNKDPNYRIMCRLRSRVWDALKPQSAMKAARTFELIGMTPENFRAYLESQFESWMTWGNYGERWEIDHISPLSAFDLTKPHQQRLAFHYSNCRPLERLANNLKGDRVLAMDELLDV
jgi:hypothetical protein